MLIKIIKSVFNFTCSVCSLLLDWFLRVMVHGNFQVTVSQHYWNQHRTLSLELLFCLYGI